MILATILKFLSGGLLTKVVGYLETKEKYRNSSEARKTEIVKKSIDAELEGRRLLTEQQRVESGSWFTHWIRPGFAWPILIYNAAIYADSLFHFEWDVQRVPEQQEKWAWIILVFYFGGRTVEKAIKIWKYNK